MDLTVLDTLSADLKRLKGVKSPSQPAFVVQARDIDSRLHDLIASSCGNTFLANELGRLKTLFRAFRDVAWEHDSSRNDYRRLAEETVEHLAIVAALQLGDAKAASGAMARHIRSGARYWSRALPYPAENNSSLRRRKGR